MPKALFAVAKLADQARALERHRDVARNPLGQLDVLVPEDFPLLGTVQVEHTQAASITGQDWHRKRRDDLQALQGGNALKVQGILAQIVGLPDRFVLDHPATDRAFEGDAGAARAPDAIVPKA